MRSRTRLIVASLIRARVARDCRDDDESRSNKTLEPNPVADEPDECSCERRITRAQFEQAQWELKQREIKFEFQDHEISHSIYFIDPDGHKLEITTYELK